MSKNGVSYKGHPKTFTFYLEHNAAVVDWDTVTSFILVAYTQNTHKELMRFAKADLTIDPTTNIAVALFPATVTAKALDELYVLEWKAKIGTDYGTNKGLWTNFVYMHLANELLT